MFKNNRKIAISKRFLIPLLFAILLFTSFGMAIDDNYAIDSNQSADGIGSELNIEDKLENSQNDIVSMSSQEDVSLNAVENMEILGKTYTLNKGGTFSDIREKVNAASAGDTIVLEGTFKATKTGLDRIAVDKKITFTSKTGATLDGQGKSYIFLLKAGSDGTSFNNLNFKNGYSEASGGALAIYSTNVKIKNCNFEGNKAHKSAAIVTGYNGLSAANLLIEKCNFIKNHADVSAGAIGVFGNNSQIVDCLFDSNGVSCNEVVYSYGGAIQVGLDTVVSKVSVKNCKFINNHVDSVEEDSHGGAGCVRNGTLYENCIFINNSARQGGALTYHASGLIKNCTFINNSAVKYGGALSTGFYYDNMSLNVLDCNFNGNKAPIGGAIQILGENINISNCNFDKNYATQIGGAINIGALSVDISNSQFNENVANVDGGAIYIKGERSSITNCLFNSNDAIPDINKLNDGLGGAIYINSTRALICDSEFYYNTARNGSAIYYDECGDELKMTNNILFKNQAWVYQLPIYANDIYYGDSEEIGSIIHGGNNIAKYGDLAVSNAIYNAAGSENIIIDGESPVSGATTSGHLYQDDREYNMDILLTVVHEDGTVVYNKTLNSNCFGEVNDTLNNLKVGRYYVTAKHFEDTYYKAITNSTTFKVTAKIDDKLRKTVNSNSINYNDSVIWTLNITNNGPSNATNVVVRDVLPEGLIWIEDDTNGKYDPVSGTLTIDMLEVGQTLIVNIKTIVNKTGNIVNDANVTADEYDWNLSNNKDNADVNVDPATDLAVVKLVNVSSPNFGDLVKWTVVVTNYGPDVAHDVVVSDVLPKSLIFVRSSSENYNKNSGAWNVGTLNKGASASLDIVCKVNATGTINNFVSVSGREYDYNMSNNQNNKSISVPKSTDLSVVKSANVSTLNFGNLVKWTIVVKNNGPDDATGVYIRDVLPSGFNLVSSSRTYRNGVINIGNLASGGSVTVEIVTRVNVTGSFVNVAEVGGNEYDWDLSNNRDDARINVNPATDLAVVKLVNVSSPNFGDLVKWTVVVTNYGPDVAHDVVVSDDLPKSLIFVRSSSDDYDKLSGDWIVGTLIKGASASLDIVCKVNATGVIDNFVSVSGDEYDYNKSNNQNNKSITVAKATDLSVVKLANVSTVDYGKLVKWTIIVTNNGPDDATGVYISDVLPIGFSLVSSSIPSNKSIFKIGNLTSGASATVEIVTRVNVTGSFVNVAEVGGNEYDWDLSNNRDEAGVTVNPATDLAVVKLVNVSSPNFGDLVKWTVVVTNYGPDVAHDVVVSDEFPKSLIFVRSSSDDYDEISRIWNVGTLIKGASASLDIICKVNATGTITNFVSVSGHEYDYNKSNNQNNKSITVAKATDLSVVKLANVSTVDYGKLVKWTIIVTNNGPNDATGVYISDAIPSGFSLVSSSKAFNNGIINIGNLASKSSISVELITKVNATGNFVNVAEVGGNEYDWNLSNNRAEARVKVNPAIDLYVIKNVNNSSPNFGDLVKWTIIASNKGPDVAHDVVVSDDLPKSLIFVRSSSNDYDKDTGLWNVGTLIKGASASLDIVCKVNATGVIDNFVSVSGREYDYDKSNNQNNKSIDVAKATDLSVVKLVNVSEVDYGQLVKWTVIATNNGPDNATGVYVDEILPNGLILINHTATKGIFDNGIWAVCCIESGGSESLELICKINKTGKITNFVEIFGNEYDYDPSNNQDNSSITVPPSSDIAVEKFVNNSNPNFGDVIEWSIVITNNGPDDATYFTVLDRLPRGLTFIDYESDVGVYEDGCWEVDYLANGDSKTLMIRCSVNSLDDIENFVKVIPSEYDWNMSNNNASKTITVNPIADLSVTKLVNVSQANYLDLVKWTLIVTNNGPNDATDVCVSDIIPKGLEIVSISSAQYSNSIWNIGNLKNGQSKQLDIICKIKSTGDFINHANVWASEIDPDLSNNDDEEYLYVAPAADISITKTVTKYSYNVGDRVRYSIKLLNRGPDRAENIEVKEIMDNFLTLNSFRASYGDFDKVNDVWSLDLLDAGKSAFLKINAIANKEGSAKNKVSVSSDTYDPDLGNNNDTVQIKVAKNNKSKDVPKKRSHGTYKVKAGSFSRSILEKNVSGNPLMLIVLLFMFSLGAFCGNNLLKKR